MGHVLRAGTQLEHGQKRGCGDQLPATGRRTCVAQRSRVRSSSKQQMRQVQMAEAAFVPGPCMFPCTSQPRGDGRLSKALRPARRQTGRALRPARDPPHGALLRGGFQPVPRGVASGTERAVARRASKGLDRLRTPMLAVPDQRMQVSVSLAKVLALRVGTSEPCGV